MLSKLHMETDEKPNVKLSLRDDSFVIKVPISLLYMEASRASETEVNRVTLRQAVCRMLMHVKTCH
jgi:hypothetical protein